MARKPGKRFTDEDIRSLTYEQAYEQLQEIVQQIEQGQVGLEESVARYEDAMKLIAHCRRILQQAEQKVVQLQQSGDGPAVLKPFEPTGPKDSTAADGTEPPASPE